VRHRGVRAVGASLCGSAAALTPRLRRRLRAAEVCAQLPAPLRPLGAYVGAADTSADGLAAACAAERAALGDHAAVLAAAAAEGDACFAAPSGALLLATALPAGWVADTLTVLRCRVRAARGSRAAAACAAHGCGD
jgi:hypothetical protein